MGKSARHWSFRRSFSSPWRAACLLVAGTGLGLGVPAVAQGGYRLGPLVRVSGASPYPAGCNGSGSQPTGAEAEPSLAVDPQDARRLVTAWKQDVGAAESIGDGAAVSPNGGRSWRRERLAGSGVCDGGPAQFTHVTDPWAVFGPSHVVWIATLPFTNGNPGAVAVNRSINGGMSFGKAGFVDRDVKSSDFDDKESIAADPRNPQRAYVTWVKQTQTPPPVAVPLGSTIYVARTRDGGATWSSTQIARTGTGTALAGGIVVVQRSGEVLLAYPKVIPDKPTACLLDQECAGRVIVYAVRSRDHGNTWSKPVIAARYRRAPVRDSEGDKIKASAEVFSLALDQRGVAYLVAHDETHIPHSQILVTRSGDGGQTWRRLPNADSGSSSHGLKLQPVIAAGRHALGILYYDFRDDHRRGDGHAMYSWWFLYSADHGRTWKEQRVSRPSDYRSAPITPTGHSIGDYFGLQAADRDFLAAIVLARPLAQRGPTDIFFRRLSNTTPRSAHRHHGRP